MWFSAIKLAVNAGSHIYKKKQETKMMMANAQAKHAEKMASGELEYSGKLLEARQSDWKDEFVLVVLTLPILVIAYGVFSDDPGASEKTPYAMTKIGSVNTTKTNSSFQSDCLASSNLP